MARVSFFVGVVCLIAGLVVGRLSSRRDAIGAGFAALGLVVGMCLGLSASPVLAATITAIFTLLGVVAPLYLKARDSDAAAKPLSNAWLFPFASVLAVGIVLGIALRVNDALDFRSVSLRDHYAALGFDEKQVDLIMDQQARQSVPLPRNHDNTSLQDLKSPAGWSHILELFVHSEDSAEENLKRLKSVVRDDAVLQAIRNWEEQKLSADQILKNLKQLKP